MAWISEAERTKLVPGKEAISAINDGLQSRYGVSLTATAIINAMTEEDIPEEMRVLVGKLSRFARK